MSRPLAADGADPTLSFDARRRGVNVGVFGSDPWPEPGIYRLYHGTTVENAEAVASHGFKVTDFEEVIAQVAAEAGLSEQQIRESLAAGSFADGRREFDERKVFFTDSPLWAADWATWGGEALLETWGAVYRIHNPTVSAMSNEHHEWAVSKIAADPAIMAFDIPLGALEAAGNRSLYPNEKFGPEWWKIREASLPMPASDAALVSWHAVERGWTWEQVSSRFNLWRQSPDKLIADDVLPKPDDRFLDGLRWWHSTLEPYWDRLSEVTSPT